MPRQQLDFLFIEMNCMHGDQAGAEQAELVQPLKRPHAVLGERALDFVLGLMHMHVHRQVELRGIRRHLAEGRIGDRVGRVRREAEGNQRLLALPVAQLEALAQIVGGIGGVRSGEVDHD